MNLRGRLNRVLVVMLSMVCVSACTVEVAPTSGATASAQTQPSADPANVDDQVTDQAETGSSESPTIEPGDSAAPDAAPDPAADAPSAPVQDRSAEAVSETFEEYRAALVSLDGERASRVVTQSTFAYYDRILDAGLNASPDELLNEIPLTDALGVLSMRAQLGTSLREVSDGFGLFVIGVERGLVGDNVGTVQLDQFVLEGDEAIGVLQGVEAMRFEYVEGRWFFDLPFTTSFIDENEDDFILGLTGGSGGRAELYDLVALGYGMSWSDLSAPVG